MERLLEWGGFAHSSTQGGRCACAAHLNQALTHLRPGGLDHVTLPPQTHLRLTGLVRDFVTGNPGDFRALGTMNENGLCQEAGLIIIHFKSVKIFSQTAPGRRRVKNPFVPSVP